MTMRVRLAGQGWEFDVGADTTLLMAAQLAGVRLPSSCRNGTCRTCICKLESGTIRYLIEWPGVSPDEKREGWILPCVSVAQSDLVLTVAATKLLLDDA